jgi:MFS family permease
VRRYGAPVPGAFAPFRHPPFRRLWAGAFVSNVGTWMEAVAVQVLVTETTRRAGWTGLVAAASFAPAAVLGPVGGALADRHPRTALLAATTSVQMLLAAALAALAATGRATPGLVTLIAFGAGCASALGFPAYQAILPDLVPRAEVVGAVALSGAQWNLGRIVGPALAGVVITAGGYAWAFAVNAVSFLAVLGAIATLRLPAPAPATGTTITAAIREGLGAVRGDPGLRVVVGAMALTSFLAAPFIGLVAAMAVTVLEASSSGTATLITAQGVGAVAMAVALGPLVGRFGNRRVLVAVLVALPVALVAYGCAPTLGAAVVAIFVVGGCYLGALSSFTGIAQLRAPAAVRGRVLSLLMVLLGVLYPLGTLVQGALADAAGLRRVTVGAAVCMLGVLAVAARRGDPTRALEPIGTASPPFRPPRPEG